MIPPAHPIAAVAFLLATVCRLADHIRIVGDNRRHQARLLALTQALMEKLKSVQAEPEIDVVKLIEADLESILETLKRRRGMTQRMNRYAKAKAENAKLKETDERLRYLNTEVVVIDSMLRLMPRFCNERAEPPSCDTGLDRSAGAFRFLEESQASRKSHRVISICGLPGIGKTALLLNIWHAAATKPPFGARAHVQIGPDATFQTITKLQAQIARQLSFKPVKFSSDEFGREALKNLFLSLKSKKKALFLAIDNIWKTEDLEKLLPCKLTSEVLPTNSCIAVTCIDQKIMEAILRICHLEEDNHLQVFRLEPECLNFEESKCVFSEFAKIQHSDPQQQDLLNEMVPLCAGLPRALEVLGTIFANKHNRRPKESQRIKEQWVTFGDAGNEGTLKITKHLRPCYDNLAPSRKAAFLDVVHSFYGWPWDVVESILDVEVMTDLRQSSLIFKVDSVDQCNQRALRDGWDISENSISGSKTPASGFVSMHDLMLRIGERLVADSYIECSFTNLDELLRAATPRNVILKVGFDYRQLAEQLLCYLQSEAAELQTPIVGDNGEYPPTIKYRSASMEMQQRQQLRVLHLYGLGWGSILEKASQEIRDLQLTACNDISELPRYAPLPNLQRLQIFNCKSLQGFSVSCVKKWENLEHLLLESCPFVTCIPQEVGNLPSLKTVRIFDCIRLQQFPSLRNARELSSLELIECPSLQLWGSIAGPLQKLVLHVDTKLELSACILQNLSLLRFLSLKGFHSVELPQQQIQGLSSLEHLILVNCSNNLAMMLLQIEGLCRLRSLELQHFDFQKLQSLNNLPNLQALLLQGCQYLEDLPEDLGELPSLQKLVLKGCKSLKKLPGSVCNVTSLQVLNIENCFNLEELPGNIGDLSLQKLGLKGCKYLKVLPDSLCSITSLQILDIQECCNLRELPKDIGELRSLTRLWMQGCRSLEKLPESLCSISSLLYLDLSRCRSLLNLPEDIGNLYSLLQLKLNGCESLKKVPVSLCRIASLKTLHMKECCSLEQLPDDLGNLCSLVQLKLSGLRNLENVPESLCRLVCLEILDIKECDSLSELPEDFGNLNSLFKLSLKGCRSLKKLPESLSCIECLKNLDLDCCESLEELPEDMGNLAYLTCLNMKECRSLKKLPDSLCRIASLEKLQMEECHSLVELPADMGDLSALQVLRLKGCKSLMKLPKSVLNISSLKVLVLDLQLQKSLEASRADGLPEVLGNAEV